MGEPTFTQLPGLSDGSPMPVPAPPYALNSGFVLSSGNEVFPRPVVAVKSKALTVWDSLESSDSILKLSTQPYALVEGNWIPEAILQYALGTKPVAINNLAYYYLGSRYILGDRLAAIDSEVGTKVPQTTFDAFTTLAQNNFSSTTTFITNEAARLDSLISQESQSRINDIARLDAERVSTSQTITNNFNSTVAGESLRLEALINGSSGTSANEIERLDTRIDLVLTNTAPEALDSLSELINNYSGLSNSLVTALNTATSRLTLVEQALESLQQGDGQASY